MNGDIISKAFTTTHALELEYRKLCLLRENESEFEPSTRTEEIGKRPLVAELACFVDVTWQ
jgi:hypothetical protein